MAVKIRLKRMGSTKQAFFRIVAADSRKAVNGRFLENLGYYDPLRKPFEIKIDENRFFHWMKNGAQISDTVRTLLKKTGTWGKWNKVKAGEEVNSEVVILKGRKRTDPEPKKKTSAVKTET